MKNFKNNCKRTSQIVVAIAMAFTFQACGTAEQEDSQLNRAHSGNGGAGKSGACKVVSGPNKGKTGTYDGEGWCTGDWGGTECQDSSGKDNGKCTDVKKTAVVKPIVIGGGLKLK
ncbi:MAG: hypothetical protein ACOH5I_20980 [Oligoflexus sp.]